MQVSRLNIRSIAIWDLDLQTAELTAKEIREETGIVAVAFQVIFTKRFFHKQSYFKFETFSVMLETGKT